MKQRADYRSLLFVVITLFLVYIPIVGQLHYHWAWLWVPITFCMSFAACIINHNHMHAPIFKSDSFNQLMQWLLTLAKGHTASTIIIPHNAIHHRFHGDQGDWMPVSFAVGKGPWAQLGNYLWRSIVYTRQQRGLESSPQLTSRQRRSYQQERFLLLGVIVALLWYDWGRALVYAGIPWGGAMLALVAVNYWQHERCELSSTYNQSRNFLCPYENWFLFNNGYHTVHHLNPKNHWHDLPAAHAAISSKMDQKLNEPSLRAYLWRVYFVETKAIQKFKSLATILLASFL